MQRNRLLDRASCAICIVAAGLLYAPIACAETLGGKIRKGNTLYKQGLYDEALETYNDAQIDAPESSELLFNIGNVKYREEDHENAIETYQKSFKTKDILLEAKANYNTGNAKYRLGEKTGNIGLWREAIEYYKRAIELNPQDDDAKYNLEFVEKKIKDALSKQRESQQEQKEEQEQQEQEQSEDARSPQGERQEQQQEQQAEEPKEQGEDERRKEQTQAAGQVPQQIEPERMQPEGDEQADDLPAQEIFSILQSEEKAARDQARAAAAPHVRRVLKDW